MKKNRSFLLLLLIILIFGAFYFFLNIKNVTENDTDSIASFNVFYPHDTGTDVVIKMITLNEKLQNDETILEEIVYYLKNPPEQSDVKLLPVMGPDAAILEVEELDNNVVKVNVNRQFISQMNAGVSFEAAILEAFAKSIADLYDADGILLRVEGQPYESGHFAFRPDEIIKAR